MLRIRLAAAMWATALAALAPAGAQGPQARPTGDPDSRMAPTRKNAAAEEVESLALALGLDARRSEPTAEHPARDDRDAYWRAGFGSWLDAQLKTSDDSIASPPAALQAFLERRQPTVWRIVAALERDTPQWDFERDEARARPERPELLFCLSLGRVLLAAALVQERSGEHALAGDLLEASWSLSRSLAVQPDLTAQLVSLAMAQRLAGVLRKMSDPPIPWLDRMSGDEPRRALLDVLDSRVLPGRRGEADSVDQVLIARARAWQAATDRLRAFSPCEAARLSSEEVWRPAAEEIERALAQGADPSLKTLSEIATPSLTSAIRRADRLAVDRELTAKVLELRQEKAASRDGRWPEKFFDADSRICPGEAYEYQARGGAMAIRFKGPIGDPGAPALALPISFEARALRPTPTPARPRRATTPSRPHA
jgi:hypothetical protein